MSTDRAVPSVRAGSGWLWVALLSVAASVARTVVDGQDLNFDLVTYHYYLGYSAFFDRSSLDFLPASFQGYQSPLPYALLYWLDSIGTPAVINACIHATVHALNLVVLFFLSEFLIAGTGLARNRVALFSLWLVGAIAPVYWHLVGTSFADLLTGVLVLSGLWLITGGLSGRSGSKEIFWPALIAGAACAGAAAGMRMHNAIYVVALLCALAALELPGKGQKGRAFGALVLSAAVGWLACFAPWAWRLYREFGNPVFPFFNGTFRSPDFPDANLPLTSFVPDSLVGLVTLPFRIATHADWVYVEGRLPDVRPALLVVCVLGLGLIRGYRRIFAGPVDDSAFSFARRFVMAFFLFGVSLWLATSCNARYGVALFLLAGPVCVALLYRMLPMRYVLLAVAATVAWQAAVQQAFFGLPRWVSAPWGAQYFDWDLPESMLREPALYLSFGAQTASSVVPRVHPESRHANLVGQYPLAFDQLGSQRVRRMIDAPDRPIFGLFDFYYTQQSDPASRSIKSYFAQHLHIWGLDFTDAPCNQVALKPASGWDWLNRMARIGYRGRPPELIVCELRTGAAMDRERALLGLRAFQAKLAPLAVACPRFFAKPLSIVRHEGSWIVMSLASFEHRFEFYDNGKFYLQQLRPPYVGLALGAVTPNAFLPEEINCAAWFARLEEVSAEASRH